MSTAGVFLAEFDRELPTTRRFLERIPHDRLSWKPHEKSMTAGQLALHIAEVPQLVLSMFLANEVSPPDMREARPQPASLAAVLETMDKSAVYVRETLPTINDQRMAETVNIVIGGRVIMSAPREILLRSILLNHWYHHRGQLGVYLRLMGVSVPSSYGPSGDESPF